MLSRVICLIIGYFVGAIIQTGFWIGKFNHIDIRNYGSGNAGTTNTMRTLGKKAGFLTYFMDAFKSCLVAIIIHFVYGSNSGVSEMLLILYGGFGVVLGHNFPFYLGFKGGKGIAVTAAVVMSAAHPLFIPTGILIFALIVVCTRYVSLGSLVVAWYIPANTLIMHRNDKGFIHMMVISLLFTAFAYFQHRQNIVRLIHGKENKIGSKKEM